MNLKILLTFDEVACSRRGRQTSLLKNALLWWALLPLRDLYLRTADDIDCKQALNTPQRRLSSRLGYMFVRQSTKKLRDQR